MAFIISNVLSGGLQGQHSILIRQVAIGPLCWFRPRQEQYSLDTRPDHSEKDDSSDMLLATELAAMEDLEPPELRVDGRFCAFRSESKQSRRVCEQRGDVSKAQGAEMREKQFDKKIY